MPGLPFPLPEGIPTLFEPGDAAGTSEGVATVTGSLDVLTSPRFARTSIQVAVSNFFHELAGNSDGTSTTEGLTLFVAPRFGRASIQILVSWIPHEMAGTITGVGIMEDAFLETGENQMHAEVDGTSTVTGSLQLNVETFITPGSTPFVVPFDVHNLTIKTWGPGGGGGGGNIFAAGGHGGGGGFAVDTVPVTPLETLDVYIGGGGGGGFGGNAFNISEGGGGGGYSGVKRTSTGLTIAGGGGGGGPDYIVGNGSRRGKGGSGGGTIGEDGTTGPGGPNGVGGGGGHQTFGGAKGESTAEDGSSYQGGYGARGSAGTNGGINGGGHGGNAGGTGDSRGGGAGAGIFGGGGGGEASGGGGGPSTTTGIDTQNLQGSLQIGAGQLDPDYPGPGYGDGGTGGPVGTFGAGTAGEGGAVYLTWDYLTPSELESVPVNGVATAQGTLDPLHPGLIPVPIPVDLLVNAGAFHELDALAAGQAAVSGLLFMLNKAVAASDGVGAATGTLDNIEMELVGASAGIATVNSVLQNGAGGVFPSEMAGNSDGVALVFNTIGKLTGDGTTGGPRDQTRFLYQLTSLGVGFDNGIDLHNGNGTATGYSHPDGDPQADFKRFLMQLVNLGVAFDDTDDVLTRTVGSINPLIDRVVGQTFPDGNIMTDWNRFLYEFVNVIEADVQTGRLTIGHTPRRATWRPITKPPVSAVRSRAPVRVGPRHTHATQTAVVRNRFIRFF